VPHGSAQESHQRRPPCKLAVSESDERARDPLNGEFKLMYPLTDSVSCVWISTFRKCWGVSSQCSRQTPRLLWQRCFLLLAVYFCARIEQWLLPRRMLPKKLRDADPFSRRPRCKAPCRVCVSIVAEKRGRGKSKYTKRATASFTLRLLSCW
jgi:hypothetical protein